MVIDSTDKLRFAVVKVPCLVGTWRCVRLECSRSWNIRKIAGMSQGCPRELLHSAPTKYSL